MGWLVGSVGLSMAAAFVIISALDQMLTGVSNALTDSKDEDEVRAPS